MKIAIVEKKGSFSDLWINYCKSNDLEYILVSPYENDIVEKVRSCDVLMYPVYQTDYRDMKLAIPLITAIQLSGKVVFPNINTIFHFDNKVAQKYVLELAGAPFIKSYVFYNEFEALRWVKKSTYPVVFKLKGGAGSSNVKLVSSYKEAKKLVRIAFSVGFKQHRCIDMLKEAWSKFLSKRGGVKELLRPIYYACIRKPICEFDKYMGNEAGYIYFQEFIPNNSYDIRVCVVAGRAFALKRMNRKDDFRASGSGHIIYDVSQIDIRCIKQAFSLNRTLKMQTLAIDFVFDAENEPKIIEISYGFAHLAYQKCEGYWTDDMKWHPGENFDFGGWMVQTCIDEYVMREKLL